MINKLVLENKTVSKSTVKKSCNANKGNKILVVHDGKTRGVEVSKEYCYKTKVGQKINLYYSESFDFYYVPYRKDEERLVWFFGVVFIFTFLNWNKITRLIKD